jgi:hypothetical protein
VTVKLRCDWGTNQAHWPPASFCFKIAIIWLSVNRDIFM